MGAPPPVSLFPSHDRTMYSAYSRRLGADGLVHAHNDATQRVIDSLSGRRTKREIIREFFGAREDELRDPERLRTLGVFYHPLLFGYGITPEDFREMFKNILPEHFLSPTLTPPHHENNG